MASGKVHGRVTITLSPFVLLTSYLYTNSITMGVYSILGCLLGLLIEPDLDVDHITDSERRLMRRFSPFGILWVILWMPYAKVIPHRHPISHVPVIGTIVRYLYLAAFLFIPVTLLGTAMGNSELFIDLVSRYHRELTWIIAGTAVSDYGHWVLDQ